MPADGGGLIGRVWDLRAFTSGGPDGPPLPAQIDITGAARNLVFGPMDILSRGRWRMTARFRLCKHAARRRYIYQFIFGDSVEEMVLQPTGPGEYQLGLENSYAHDGHAALRLWLAEPAFHGALQFLGASAEPLTIRDDPGAAVAAAASGGAHSIQGE